MSTVSTVLKLQDQMSKQLNNIEKSLQNTQKACKNVNISVENVDNSMKKAQGSSSSLFESLMKFNVLSSVFSMIRGQLDSAINRFDTLNNYNKTMENLGFSGDSAGISIEYLKQKLDGLPTALNDAVLSVQRFASANENLEASTKMFTALNDAILAGNAPLMQQQSALEQVTQAYTKGKFDAMEYKTMLSAMPAQLKQVAQAMGYTNTALGGDFYTALQKGQISLNDFMKKMVELDEAEGGFAKQARDATNGIQTAFTNMRTAVTKGLADMIEKINKGLESSGLPTIQEMITKTGKTLQNILITVGNAIQQVIIWASPLLKLIQQHQDYIQMLAIVITTVVIATKLWAAAQAILNSQLLIPVLIIVAIVSAIYLIVNAINDVTGSTYSAVGVITGILAGLAAFIYDVVILPIWNGFAELVNFLANCFKNPVASIKILFLDMCKNILTNVSSVVSGLLNLINMIPGVEISLSNGITNLLQSIDASIEETKANSGWEDVMPKKEAIDLGDAYSKGYDFGANIGKGVSKALDTSMLVDWDNLSNTIGTDSTGGKAVKTTTKDNLLSDEDIQLLLDVATRDYQLNYQQVTPNISVSFGDVRETADVDSVLEAVGARVEELINGDAEVVY